jgi:hypothetical protein
MSRDHLYRTLLLMACVLAAGSFRASATTTQGWEVSGFEDMAKGEFEGTILTSSGEIQTGWDTVRRELVEDASLWSFVEAKGGDIYFGTGNRGVLYLLRGTRLYELTETESVVLTALALDKKGNLYAAGMPGAEIYKFTPKELKDLTAKASEIKGKDLWKKREYKSDKKGKDKDKEEDEDKEKEDKKKSKDLKAKKGKDKDEDKEKDKDKDKEKVKEDEDKADKDKDEKDEKAEKDDSGEKKEDKVGEKEKDEDEAEAKKKGKAKETDEKKKEAKAKKKGKKEDEEKKKKRKGPEPWATIEDADQIWSLLYDPKRNLLFAGTGPDGKIFSLDMTGRANLYIDTEEDHVLSLARVGSEAMAAGTGNDAKLLLIEGAGRGSVLWDFDATEVKSVVRVEGPKGKGALVCAVNKFKSLPPLPASKPTLSSLTGSKGKQPMKSPKLDGEGMVAAVFDDGGMRQLFEDKKAHFTVLQASSPSAVRFGDGEKGRIYEVDLEGNYSILFDLDERQVLTFCFDCKDPFIGTSDPAAIHRIVKGPPASPHYVSEVFDAGFPARWGRLVLRSHGKVAWQVRSGNTSEPDRWWTDWSKPQSNSNGDISIKPGRFFQFRVRVTGTGQVWNARIFYLPANQQAVIREVTVDGDGASSTTVKTSKSKAPKKNDKHDPVINLKWEVDNPDDDELLYRLYFAKEGEEIWISMLKEDEELTEKKYKWDTTSIPAGYYLVKVEASDEPSNDQDLVITHVRVSKPILVDNDPPQITLNVAVAKAGIVVSGKVTDNFSPLSKFEFSIDGKPWKDIFPTDLIFDEQIEPFSFEVKDLAAGAHTITLRAWDEAKNLTSTGENFVIKKKP